MNKTVQLNEKQQVWESLLTLQKEITKLKDSIVSLSVTFYNNGLHLNNDAATNPNTIFHLNLTKDSFILKEKSIYKVIKEGFTTQIKTIPNSDFISLYLPYCILPVIAHVKQRSISISHFAQSLDGKIATESGSSKWIGNEENLIHSHRMRALCAGILVGRKTVEIDKPRLNVRLCSGENPQKIAVGNFTKNKNENELIDSSYLAICTSKSEHFNGNSILKELYKKGIYSVYIEGGSRTSSAFLKSDSIDELQLHIAPLILGSGISNFSLPTINCISEGIQFDTFDFVKTGDAMMFIGSPKKKA